jgi:hypothetical protein
MKLADRYAPIMSSFNGNNVWKLMNKNLRSLTWRHEYGSNGHCERKQPWTTQRTTSKTYDLGFQFLAVIDNLYVFSPNNPELRFSHEVIQWMQPYYRTDCGWQDNVIICLTRLHSSREHDPNNCKTHTLWSYTSYFGCEIIINNGCYTLRCSC